MMSSEPLQSSFKARTILNSKIRYIHPEKPSTVNRDYGLMRISVTEASTPHPRFTLRADDNCHNALSAESSDGNINYSSSIRFDKRMIQMLRKVPPEHMLIGTPHPTKGFAIDPHLLVKDFLAKREKLSILRNSFQEELSTTPSSILKKSRLDIDLTKSKRKRKNDRKVILIEPKVSFSLTSITSPISSSASLSELQVTPPFPGSSKNQNLSFVERRRLFNLAEFTIAKNGKKMNEYIMPIKVENLVCLESEIAQKDMKAINEINEYIKKHGYAVSQCAATTPINFALTTSI